DVGDAVLAIEVPEQPEQHVEDDDRPRIADMGEVVNGRPADIHPHVLAVDGDKILLRPRQRVVEPQAFTCFGHASTSLSRRVTGRRRKASLLAWAFVFGKKAKTSGPARALANNATAANRKRRFHGMFMAFRRHPRQARPSNEASEL